MTSSSSMANNTGHNGTKAGINDDHSNECTDDGSTTDELVHDKLPSSNNMIRGQKDLYAVGRKIAPGKYGAVYEANNCLIVY